jgi:TetR/AcrR family transcriptional repressor of nem operon
MRVAQEHSPTKEKLLESAQQLMLAKGYGATTVDEICKLAGVTKGSFFHYFERKEDLGKAALDHFVAFMFQTIQGAPFHNRKEPLQRIYGYLDFLIALSKNPDIPNSCLLGNFSQELSDSLPEIRSQCERHFDQWSEAFKKELDEAKTRYCPKAAIDTYGLAEHLIAIMEGSIILAKAKQDKKIIEKNLEHFKQYLKALFKK